MRGILIIGTLALVACPPTTDAAKTSGPVEICTKAGEQCMFAPGKIGLCVEKPQPCDGKPCFSCQSQH